jgi:hypothetical protein
VDVRFRQDLGGCYHSLTEVLSRRCPERNEENQERFSLDSLCIGRHYY